ncbi:MAG: purine-nucleoside phosphorylase, partial [Lachnospiraceae bacterium]|nr:purine-nucleoside phosphorylase [Lachnospiraceae bacterium]
IITNACGGISEGLRPGDLMMITDHINLTCGNSLIGPNDDRLGPRFPDMTEAYNSELMEHAKRTAGKTGIELKEGVYALFPGPCYETAAEIRAFKAMGADAVGMSTVPEVIAANYLGMRVLGISCINNMATGIAKEKHTHEEVLKVAGESSRKLAELITDLIKAWPIIQA